MVAGRLFHCMAARPWPWLILVPAVYIVLIVVAYTSQENNVESSMRSNMWMPTKVEYVENQEYLKSWGIAMDDEETLSIFSAIAVARDAGNLLTESRLDEIMARMKATEATTVEHMGTIYTWDDICASNSLGPGTGTDYQLPCARISPMDYFQEARWEFDEKKRLTWYEKVVREQIVQPRIPRYGMMRSETCASQCLHRYKLRTDPEYAKAQGYHANYAFSSIALLEDVGNMEYNDPCKMCIEDNYSAVMDKLLRMAIQIFEMLSMELNSSRTFVDTEADRIAIFDLANKTRHLAESLTKADIEDWYFYYTARLLYSEIGKDNYIRLYNASDSLFKSCPLTGSSHCPPLTVSMKDVQNALFNHADNVFSSVTTAGSPLPVWGNGDGTGFLFDGNHPVSGSGVQMSQNLSSVFDYIDTTNYRTAQEWKPMYGNGGFADPLSPDSNWTIYVENNPIYSWFMANLAPADEGTACGNGTLTGTNTGRPEIDEATSLAVATYTSMWCTKYEVGEIPNGTYTKQHFGRMWYDLLIDSHVLLNIQKGVDDPYTWTLGTGCGYNFTGQRDSYKNKSDEAILQQGSGQLYFLDEGVNVGVIPQDLVLGGMTPAVEAYSQKTTLDRVSVIQMLFPSLTAKELPQRVSSCNRPGGKLNITEQDAKEVLKRWKEAMEEAWNKGWDDESDGEVQFVSVYDETSVVGTTGRLLDEITLQSGRIMIISMAVLVILSTLFFFNFDLLESRLVLSLVGVALIVLSFLAATGFTILVGIRIDVKVAWTLPFVLIGIGVDIVFIVLMAVQKQGGLDELSYLRTMRETVVPVSMASLVNVCMFATMTLSDIPALYLTAQVAVAVIIAVYVAVIFCFPAYCYLDIRRQASGRFDILYCRKIKDPPQEGKSEDWRNRALFNFFYQPIVLGSNRRLRLFAHAVIFLCSAVLLVVAICGITQREVAAGPEDLFPSTHSAYHWATVRQQDIVASAAITMNWGEIQYTSPNVQMKMIKQFEDLVTSPNFDQHDTQNLWIARFLLWTTRHCDENFDLSSTVNKCGRDQFHNDSESHCAGAWVENKFELRETTVKLAGDSCNPYRGGICRPVSQMHRDDLAEMFLTLSSDDEGQSFCPVIDDWSNSKWQFCMEQWHRITGAGGQFVQNNAAQSSRTRQQCTEGDFDVDDETILWPIKHSASPAVLSFGRVSKDGIQEILEMTRAICDADTDIHCWMSGVPYDYWSQYGDVFGVLIKLCLYATFVGFAVSFVFLFAQFIIENHHGRRKILGGSLIGAFLIALNVVLSLVTVTGLSCFSEVNLTWLSVMSIVLSVGFSVEYSVQIVSRWLRSEMATGRSFQRVHQTMSFLMIPTFMSFVSSTLGVVCLALAEFTSTQEFFFRPLIIVMFVTYFFGCWFLPVLLCYIDFDVVKLGKRPFDNDNATCPVGRATLIYVQGEATESTDEEVYIAERNVRPNDSSDQQNLEPPDNIITVPSGPSTNEEDERPEERVSNEVGNITAQQPSNSTTSDDTSSGPHASRSPQLSTYSSDDIYLTESDPCSDSIQELASHEQLSDDAETVKTGQVLRKQPPPKLNSLKESTAVTKTKSAAHIAAGRVPVDVLEKLDILIEAHRTGVTATVVGSTTAQPAGYREKEDDSIPALQKGAFFSTEKLERGNVRNDEMTRSSPKRSRAATPPQRTTTDLQMKELDEKWMERQRIRETCVVLTELQEKWMKIQLKREKAVVGRNNTDIVATYPPTKDSETCHPTDKEPINGNIASQESAKKAVVADNASVRKEKSSEDDSDSGIIASYSTRSLTSSSDVPPFTVTSDKDCLEKPKGEEL